MAVSSIVNRVSFTGNASTTSFGFPYYLISPNFDLEVYLVDTLGNATEQFNPSQWSFSGTAVGNGTYPNGGNVVMVAAPPTGYTLVIVRNPADTQGTHWVDGDPDPAAVKELAFDRLTLLVQRLLDLSNLSPVMPDSTGVGFTGTLPTGIIPANSAIMTNALGTGFVFGTPGVTTSGSQATPVQVNGVNGIYVTAGALFQTIFVQGVNSFGVPTPETITANPQIQAGTIPGQILCIMGTDSTNTVTVANGTGLVRNGGYTYGQGSSTMYMWNGANWSQLGMDNEL